MVSSNSIISRGACIRKATIEKILCVPLRASAVKSSPCPPYPPSLTPQRPPYKKNEHQSLDARILWSERRDLNPRPLPPQGSALPGCATFRPTPRRARHKYTKDRREKPNILARCVAMPGCGGDQPRMRSRKSSRNCLILSRSSRSLPSGSNSSAVWAVSSTSSSSSRPKSCSCPGE